MLYISFLLKISKKNITINRIFCMNQIIVLLLSWRRSFIRWVNLFWYVKNTNIVDYLTHRTKHNILNYYLFTFAVSWLKNQKQKFITLPWCEYCNCPDHSENVWSRVDQSVIADGWEQECESKEYRDGSSGRNGTGSEKIPRQMAWWAPNVSLNCIRRNKAHAKNKKPTVSSEFKISGGEGEIQA